MKFLSLKWKALIITSVLFLSLFAGRAITTHWFFTQQLNERRENDANQNKNIFNAVVTKTYSDLDRHAAELASLQGIADSLAATHNEKSTHHLESNLNEYWWRLQLELDVTTIGIYDRLNQPLVLLGEKNIPNNLVWEARRTEAPSTAWPACLIAISILHHP